MEIPIKRPVSLRAITERINRKLKKEGQKLVKNSPRWVSGYGSYMIVDLGTNSVEAYNIEDLEVLARELECLAEWEVVE